MEITKCVELAEEIRKKYNPDYVSPFPYENIEKDHDGLDIFITSDIEDSNVSGVTLYNKEKDTISIFINKNKHINRQYFTIAHELGHYFLHKDIIKTEEILIDFDRMLDGNRALFRLDESTSNMIETEANNFAAALIMPEDFVVKAWNRLDSVEETARVFNVSVSAMSIRLEKLGLIE